MNEELFEEVLDDKFLTQGKVYTKSQVRWAAIFGGAFAVAFLFGRNFKVFGEVEKLRFNWVGAVFYNTALFSLSFAIPETEDIPNLFFTIITVIVANGLFSKFLESKTAAHIKKSGKVQSGGSVFGFIVLSLVMNIAFAISINLIFNYEDFMSLLSEYQLL
jgi:hypothetical protein